MEERPQAALSTPRLSSASDVIDALGGTNAVAELLDIGASSVSNYRKLGFPARSHFILAKICAERGLNVADAVFGGYQVKPQAAPYQPAPTQASDGIKQLEEAGFRRLSLPILQPAAPFIDRMGPEMQRRLFTFTDPGGEQLCLRPDLTIPTALAHIAAGQNAPARYCYQGTAFRYQPRGSGQPEEFTQLGLEIIGGDDGLENDMEVIFRILETAQNAGLKLDDPITIKVTDYDMFTYFLNLLGVSDEQQITVRRTLERARNIDDFMRLMAAQAKKPTPINMDNIANDPQRLIAGRTGAEIKSRLEIKQASQQNALPLETLEKIAAFLHLSETPGGIEKYDSHFPNMRDWFTARIEELATNIVPVMADYLSLERLHFAPGINKSMAYYTGLSFEIFAKGMSRPIAAGGRYDDLLRSLGAGVPMAAVGGAIALERLQRVIEGQS
jgi:ATP phosphoribosyltransferase regulatory subunit